MIIYFSKASPMGLFFRTYSPWWGAPESLKQKQKQKTPPPGHTPEQSNQNL